MNVIHWRVCKPSEVRYILQFVQVRGKIEIWYLTSARINADNSATVTAVWKIKPHKS